jgi:hypothetical protein
MTPNTDRAVIVRDRRRRAAGIAGVALMLSGFGLTGCGVVRAVNKVRNAVDSNRGIIDQFTSNLKSGGATTFEATYKTNGTSPSTIVYAVKPPKGLAFKDSQSGGADGVSNVDIIVNSSGEYSCSPPSSGAQWTCQKLGAAKAAVQNKIFGFYTPSHWVSFLRDFSLAAGFAGDKVSSSSMTKNGFSMHCVDFRAAGVPGTSTICTTSQGILGYVKVASSSTTFELKSYSGSPSASLFKLPPGAKVTKASNGSL